MPHAFFLSRLHPCLYSLLFSPLSRSSARAPRLWELERQSGRIGLDRSNLTDLPFAFGDLNLLWQSEDLRANPTAREGKRRATIRLFFPRKKSLGPSWRARARSAAVFFDPLTFSYPLSHRPYLANLCAVLLSH